MKRGGRGREKERGRHARRGRSGGVYIEKRQRKKEGLRQEREREKRKVTQAHTGKGWRGKYK